MSPNSSRSASSLTRCSLAFFDNSSAFVNTLFADCTAPPVKPVAAPAALPATAPMNAASPIRMYPSSNAKSSSICVRLATDIVSCAASAKPSVTIPFPDALAVSLAKLAIILELVFAALAPASLAKPFRNKASPVISTAVCGTATKSERNANSASGSSPASRPSLKFSPDKGTKEEAAAPVYAPRLNDIPCSVLYRPLTTSFSSGVAVFLTTFSAASLITRLAAICEEALNAPRPAAPTNTEVPPVANAAPTVSAREGAACPMPDAAWFKKPPNVGLS